MPQDKVAIGIPGYSRPDDNRLWLLLTMPFRRQREYWRAEGGQSVERDAADLTDNPRRLSE